MKPEERVTYLTQRKKMKEKKNKEQRLMKQEINVK